MIDEELSWENACLAVNEALVILETPGVTDSQQTFTDDLEGILNGHEGPGQGGLLWSFARRLMTSVFLFVCLNWADVLKTPDIDRGASAHWPLPRLPLSLALERYVRRCRSEGGEHLSSEQLIRSAIDQTDSRRNPSEIRQAVSAILINIPYDHLRDFCDMLSVFIPEDDMRSGPTAAMMQDIVVERETRRLVVVNERWVTTTRRHRKDNELIVREYIKTPGGWDVVREQVGNGNSVDVWLDGV